MRTYVMRNKVDAIHALKYSFKKGNRADLPEARNNIKQ